MISQSRLRGQATKIVLATPPGAPEAALLLVEVAIDCPECGQHVVRFAGHHLRALRNLLVEFIDLHPDLCGDESGIEVLSRLQFEGRGGGDPTAN